MMRVIGAAILGGVCLWRQLTRRREPADDAGLYAGEEKVLLVEGHSSLNVRALAIPCFLVVAIATLGPYIVDAYTAYVFALWLSCVLFYVNLDAVTKAWEGRSAMQGRRVVGGKDAFVKHAAALSDLAGSWVKDKEVSDSMEAAMDLAQLNRVVRGAVGLIRGMNIIVLAPGRFELQIFSAIPWFKIIERYPTSGDEVEQKRRDLRRGRHRGCVTATKDGHVHLSYEWGDPLGGRGHDDFSVTNPDELTVVSKLTIQGQASSYRTVYRRKR